MSAVALLMLYMRGIAVLVVSDLLGSLLYSSRSVPIARCRPFQRPQSGITRRVLLHALRWFGLTADPVMFAPSIHRYIPLQQITWPAG